MAKILLTAFILFSILPFSLFTSSLLPLNLHDFIFTSFSLLSPLFSFISFSPSCHLSLFTSTSDPPSLPLLPLFTVMHTTLCINSLCIYIYFCFCFFAVKDESEAHTPSLTVRTSGRSFGSFFTTEHNKPPKFPPNSIS